jgi:hypothetical protein
LLTFEDRLEALGAYPAALRRRGTQALDSRNEKERHEATLRFGLDAMKFLASLAFADYRRDRHASPDLKVETALGALRRHEDGVARASAGTWKELVALAANSASPPALFDMKMLNKTKLREIYELKLLIETLDLAAAPSLMARSIKPLLDRDMRRSNGTEKESWFVAWDLVTAYRNHISHDDEYHWLDLGDFYATVTPYLEAVIVAAFLHEQVTTDVGSTTICQLTSIDQRDGQYLHSFVEEPEGKHERHPPIALKTRVVERWQHPDWRAEIGSVFLLRDSSTGSHNPILFRDFLQHGPPRPITHAAGADSTAAATQQTPQSDAGSGPAMERGPKTGEDGKAPPTPLEDMFRPCPAGVARLADELAEAPRDNADIWWRLRPKSGVWLGEYFAFWRKTATKPCDQVWYGFDEQRPDYPVGDYGAARFGEPSSRDGSWSKATVVHASPGLLSDDDATRVYCGLTNYNFSHHWAEENHQRLLDQPSRASLFGVSGRLAFPGIGVLHALMCTSDGYIVFSLRSIAPDFYKLKWSATFEEQIWLDRRDHVVDRADGDRHVLDTVVGGLDEEFALDATNLAAHTCLAIDAPTWI